MSIKTTGHEKDRFTVMLTCTADGGKLAPLVVFKRKTLPKETFPKGVHVRVHPKGWMDEGLVLDWLDTVWGRRDGGMLRKPSMLVLDSFRCHKTPAVLEFLKKEQRTVPAIIPGGLTSILQPLDVAINKPFKDRMRLKWSEWMATGEPVLTKMGRRKKVDLPTICNWILQSWEDIPEDVVRRSFLKTGIANKLDGTEDDLIWCDKVGEGEDEADDDEDDAEVR